MFVKWLFLAKFLEGFGNMKNVVFKRTEVFGGFYLVVGQLASFPHLPKSDSLLVSDFTNCSQHFFLTEAQGHRKPRQYYKQPLPAD